MLVAACAAPDDVPEGEDGRGDTDTTTDDKADATGELRARIDGLTVWVDPVVRVIAGPGGRRWVIEGRASRNLDAVHAWVPDDAFGEPAITGKRTFTVTLGSGHEQNTLLSGMPIFVRVEPVTGEPADAAVWIAPRLARFTGSGSVYLFSEVRPVWVGGDVVYRGGAAVAAGWGGLAVTAAAGAGPEVVAEAARRFRIDWRFDALAAVTGAAGRPVRATATRDGEVAEKLAGVEVRVTALGLTRRDPRELWEARCEPAVSACLVALGADAVDAAGCGGFRQVAACGGPAAAAGPSPGTLAGDLRDWLAYWYGIHEAGVAMSGGRTLAAAQAAVDPAAFEELVDPEDDPYGNDLSEVRVYRHHDVVWPGSDIVWYLVYERRSATFLEAYHYN